MRFCLRGTLLLLGAVGFVSPPALHAAPFVTSTHTVSTASGPANVALKLNALGYPVISYRTSGSVFLVTCVDAACASPASTTTVDGSATQNVIAPTSLHIAGGAELISYSAFGEGLKLAACVGAVCPFPAVVLTNETYSGASMQVGGPLQYISYATYRLGGDGDLKLLVCGNDCANVNVITTVDAGGVDYLTTLQLSPGGLPVIAYHSSANKLKLAFCGDAFCQPVLATFRTLDDAAISGHNVIRGSWSIAFNGANPVISYFGIDDTLKLAICNDATCSSATLRTVASGGEVGHLSSLQILNGNPVISYLDYTNSRMKLAVCNDPTCTAPTITTIDNSFGDPSMQVSGGNLLIAYPSGNLEVKLATVRLDPPTVASIVRAGASPINAASVAFTVTFSDAVAGVDASDFVVTQTGTAAYTGMTVSADSGLTRTVTLTGVSGNGTLRLSLADDDTIAWNTLKLGGDGVGNGDLIGEAYTIDQSAPGVTSVSVPAGGNHTASSGANLDFTVNWSEAVTVDTTGGTPFLSLTIGSATVSAAYVSGSGTAALVFRYTVVASDNDDDGIAVGSLALGGGTLKDAAGNAATLNLNGVAATTGIFVNRSQAITFANPGAQNFGTTPTLTATASSGLAVSFTSATTGVCTITTGGALTFVAPGTCTINADQAGNADYNAAPQVQRSFAVNPVIPAAPVIGTATGGNTQISVSFTATPDTLPQNGGATITSHRAECTSSDGGAAGNATGSSSPILVTGLTNSKTYTCTVKATNSAGDSAASAASNSVIPVFNTYTSGGMTVSFTGGGATCTFAPIGTAANESSFFIPLTGHPKSPPSAPPGVSFPFGLLDFVLTGCAGTVTFNVVYTGALPANTAYWKYGPTATKPVPHWYVIASRPGTTNVAGDTRTFSITDGGLGDDDLAANGTIVDQGGPGAGGAIAVPTLSEWAMILLGLMMAGWAFRRRRGHTIALCQKYDPNR